MIRILSFSLCCIVLAVFSLGVSAQDSTPSPTPTPVSAELQELINQNAILEEKKKAAQAAQAIAEAEKAEQAAKYPKPTTTPLAGTTEVDAGVKIESEMMAYRSMANAANRIVTDVEGTKDAANIKKLAIHSEAMIRAMLGYNVTAGQLNELKAEYNNLLVNPPIRNDGKLFKIERFDGGLTIAAATSILGAAVDLLAYFRTDTKIVGNTFKIEEPALTAEVYRAFRKRPAFENIPTYYPAEFPPTSTTPSISFSGFCGT